MQDELSSSAKNATPSSLEQEHAAQTADKDATISQMAKNIQALQSELNVFKINQQSNCTDRTLVEELHAKLKQTTREKELMAKELVQLNVNYKDIETLTTVRYRNIASEKAELEQSLGVVRKSEEFLLNEKDDMTDHVAYLESDLHEAKSLVAALKLELDGQKQRMEIRRQHGSPSSCCSVSGGSVGSSSAVSAATSTTTATAAHRSSRKRNARLRRYLSNQVYTPSF
jgi:DNA repair exonuclease SbcCD ATPase subunit